MAKLKKGDRVYFTSVGRMVNEGTVEEIDGIFVKVESKVPGDGWYKYSELFSTRHELTESAVYSARYFENQMRQRARQQSMFRMCSL